MVANLCIHALRIFPLYHFCHTLQFHYKLMETFICIQFFRESWANFLLLFANIVQPGFKPQHKVVKNVVVVSKLPGFCEAPAFGGPGSNRVVSSE
jgi:hypothetical protein